jgi:uncharacterized repeat protein (TIGR03803 family)
VFPLKFSRRHNCASVFVFAILSLTALNMALTRAASAQTLTTLTNFDNVNGQSQYGGLFADASGNLLGTSRFGGANDDGTVFEIVKTSSGYASTPTILVNFNGTNGLEPDSTLMTLMADANGNLFGTTVAGGTSGDGTVFEIAKTASGYASSPTTLVSFSGANGAQPSDGLLADASGDLFGTTVSGGTSGNGTVFEIVKTSSGYASAPTTLVSFNGTNGAAPYASLIADANGDLFGATYSGGTLGDGTVFEIVKTSSGYASTPTTLVNFNGTNGSNPQGSLIADASGDLIGTTYEGGALGDGTVFEIVKSSSGFASTPTTLVNFDGTNGAQPADGVIADAEGNLFGTTFEGGTGSAGTIFEIAKTNSGYASTPTTLINFDGTNGANPVASLIADSNGNLYGTTYEGGVYNAGTVFELSGSGYVSLIPFASFQADLAISTMQPYGYALAAEFATSSANTAIDPATEAVTLEIANYTLIIPAGSFQTIGSAYVYGGTINGATILAGLTPLGGNKYAFAAIGSPVNLSAATNPVTVNLTIGTNTGSSQVNAIRLP